MKAWARFLATIVMAWTATAAAQGEEGRGRLLPPDISLAGLELLLLAPNDCFLNDALWNSEEGGCRDLTTGLVWSEDSIILGMQNTWDGAQLYCQTLEEGGYDDWFLPSKDQMLEGAANGAAAHFTMIDGIAWSSTPKGNNRAWAVNMVQGFADTDFKASTRNCRCVRDPGGPPPPPDPDVLVDSITPNQMQEQSTVAVTIAGSGFQSGAVVTLESGSGPGPGAPPTAGNVVFVDSGTLTADVTAGQNGNFKRTRWDVVVTNPDGTSGTLPDGLQVRSN